MKDATTEPYVPVPPPESPGFSERVVPTCPICDGLCRRNLSELPPDLPGGDRRPGPWRCDLHGEVTPRFDTWEVPTDD